MHEYRDYDEYDDDPYMYEDPPLYADGVLAGMTVEALVKERNRQSNIHDCAVDRCEEINSPTIETAAARIACVHRELERRGLPTNFDLEDLEG